MIFIKKEYVYGWLASIIMFLFYFSIVSYTRGFSHAVEQFIDLWFLMIPLIAGFGIQISLFLLLRSARISMMSILASGSVSAGSMVACCAHHATDILAFIGLAGIVSILAEYQWLFLLIGVISNIAGIITLLVYVQKSGLHSNIIFSNTIFALLLRYDLSPLRNALFALGAMTMIIALFVLIF